eukprot:GHVP01044050.1.p1 GENE.GHVP01044050.1~~GHVP01044050.1.p1  ORF type:complete len:104 (+),score=8.69 GHVP01044050.1:31-312(+)
MQLQTFCAKKEKLKFVLNRSKFCILNSILADLGRFFILVVMRHGSRCAFLGYSRRALTSAWTHIHRSNASPLLYLVGLLHLSHPPKMNSKFDT